MRWIKNSNFYQLRLERDEEILTTLVEFVRKKKIKSGLIFGLGAGRDFVLGYYHLEKKVYHRRRLRAEYEICSLVGNIAWDKDEPVCHIHAVLSNQKMATAGGHLFAGRVAATCEIAIIPGTGLVRRELEPDTGLKLLQLNLKPAG